MDSRQNHDGRRDPTGSGRNQGEKLSLPLIGKRSKFRRSRPRRFVETEREIESTRPSTQQDERPQGTTATPSASQSLHLPALTVTAIRARDDSSPVRQTNSSPNNLTLPPIETNRVPTPRPPQTPNNSNRQANLRARYNVSDGHATAPSPTPAPQHCNVLMLEFPLPSSGHNSRASSRNSARASRDANSASRNANSASRDSNSASRNANSASRNNGGNVSRQSGLLGISSARSRDHASSASTSSGQPVPPTAPYKHQGSNSDGALIITGIKPAAPSGRVCNSNTLRRHSTGGKMVPKHEKTNQGLIVLDESFLKPKPPEEPKSRPPSSQRRPSRTSLKSKRSSNHQKNTSQADDDYPPDFEPLSGEEEVKAANNSRAPSSRAVSRPPSSIPEEIEGTSSKAVSRPPSSIPEEIEGTSSKAVSRPPSSIPEEIKEDGRYDYSDDKFEVYEDEERPQAGSPADSEASIPEELPGQSEPYNYQDDDIPPETDIPEEIVTSDDDDEDDDSRPVSRC